MLSLKDYYENVKKELQLSDADEELNDTLENVEISEVKS